MKPTIRALIASAFLLALASPAWATPDAAIRLKPSKNCVLVQVKNVRGAGMAFPMADMAIFDQKTCKKICATKIKIGKKLAACQNFEFKICCDAKLPPVYIIYVRVHHTFGSSEQWFFSN